MRVISKKKREEQLTRFDLSERKHWKPKAVSVTAIGERIQDKQPAPGAESAGGRGKEILSA